MRGRDPLPLESRFGSRVATRRGCPLPRFERAASSFATKQLAVSTPRAPSPDTERDKDFFFFFFFFIHTLTRARSPIEDRGRVGY